VDLDPSICSAMVAAIPERRAFAVSLCNVERADDLVQETLLRACNKIELFEPNSQMLPWLITILRNQFYSECRKRRREVEDVDGIYAETLGPSPARLRTRILQTCARHFCACRTRCGKH